MGYIEKNLLSSNETVKNVPQKNMMYLVGRWIWGILGCWLLFIPTIKAISATIRFNSIEYMVTDNRVIEKHGAVATKTNEMPLNKIENITVEYTFWGKIFNYATIRFNGTDYRNIMFHHIKNAEEVRKQIRELL